MTTLLFLPAALNRMAVCLMYMKQFQNAEGLFFEALSSAEKSGLSAVTISGGTACLSLLQLHTSILFGELFTSTQICLHMRCVFNHAYPV